MDKTVKVFVTNITHDTVKKSESGQRVYRIDCDRRMDGSDNIEQDTIICSEAQHADIMKHGYYMAEWCKVFVTNITSDVIKEPFPGISMHHIICDRRVDGSDIVDEQGLMICSQAEYASIMADGYFWVECEPD